MKVYLVDDDYLHHKTSGLVLQELGLNYKIAKDAVEALKQIKKNKFDLVLMNIVITNLNGTAANLSIRDYNNKQPSLSMALTSFKKTGIENPGSGSSH